MTCLQSLGLGKPKPTRCAHRVRARAEDLVLIAGGGRALPSPAARLTGWEITTVSCPKDNAAPGAGGQRTARWGSPGRSLSRGPPSRGPPRSAGPARCLRSLLAAQPWRRRSLRTTRSLREHDIRPSVPLGTGLSFKDFLKPLCVLALTQVLFVSTRVVRRKTRQWCRMRMESEMWLTLRDMVVFHGDRSRLH